MANLSKNLRVFFDTDVIINWLAKEVEPETGFKLWLAPYNIVKLLEGKKFEGHSSLINILEIRFVLRRKKGHSEKKIQELINEFREKFIVDVPDSIDLMSANNLQQENPLDPFDSIYLILSQLLSPAVVLTRDQDFTEIMNEIEDLRVKPMTPEEFLKEKFPKVYEKIKSELKRTG